MFNIERLEKLLIIKPLLSEQMLIFEYQKDNLEISERYLDDFLFIFNKVSKMSQSEYQEYYKYVKGG